MFKKEMYEAVVAQLNDNTKDTKFQGGYLIGIYGQGVPYVVNSSSLSQFDYQREIVIPVSEEYFTETPSVNLADRSDYVAQYQIMFQTQREDEVMTVMDEFRAYYFANKQLTVDGYTVAIKTTRGDKQPAVDVDHGNFYVRFKINVYLTAIKNGYIYKDTDKWELRLQGVGDYETLKLADDVFTTTGNPEFSNETGISKGIVSTTTANSDIRFFYNSQPMEKKVYDWLMNKLDKDTLFDFKHTFDGTTYTYIGLIVSATRVRLDNGVAILKFGWIEADI